MIQIKAALGARTDHMKIMWEPIQSAPFDRELELAVLDEDGEHALVFPCKKILGGWQNAASGVRVEIRPTHWRDWRRVDRATTDRPASQP
ncbi:hypothetical protein [Mesorhizobium sp. B2-3-5]|uniref:hypothetical protein n=1 Tax=Mesorhizobium sp. B2-3-5 TaxID=2589958 RepID=UPI0032B24CF0